MGLKRILFVTGVFAVSALASASDNSSKAPEPWDLSYLLDLDPNRVTPAELEAHAAVAEEHFKKYSRVNGMVWQVQRTRPEVDEPDMYGSGGDTAIWTGHSVAAAIFKFKTLRRAEDLEDVLEALRGLHILTHISGVPGVLARCAFPLADAKKWNWPDAWAHRKPYIYVSSDRVPDILNPGQTYPQMGFYTRATRDQMTGVLLGLSVAWKELSPSELSGYDPALIKRAGEARMIASTIANSLWLRLNHTRFVIKDHAGATGTNADTVSGLLKLQLFALRRAILRETPFHKAYKRVNKDYDNLFRSTIFYGHGAIEDIFNPFSNLFQYYAWNLRFARFYSIRTLEHDRKLKERLDDYAENKLWKWVRSHQNPHFTYFYNAARSDLEPPTRLGPAAFQMKAYSLRPLRGWSSPLHDREKKPPTLKAIYGDITKYVVPAHLREPTTYFLWQDEPWVVGVGLDKLGSYDNTGMDFLLPYWLGRYKRYLE